MKLSELGVTGTEWARLYRLSQVDDVPDDVSPAVVVAEVRRIVSGEDAPYDEGPPFSQLAGLIEWLDRRGYLAVAEPAVNGIVEYRDVRPSGSVISEWACPEGRESGNDYQQFGPGVVPDPPWERQRRVPGGDWVTTMKVQEDGSVVEQRPDGSVIISKTWWEQG